jgi:UPF0755 protein
MSKSRSALPALLLLPIIATIILGGCLTLNFILSIPAQAEEIFGPPAEYHSFTQRLRLSALLMWEKSALITPIGVNGTPQSFEIKFGESIDSIIQRLVSHGLIANPTPFRNYLSYSGHDTHLQAGYFELSNAMTPLEVANVFLDAAPNNISLFIFAGWRHEEIAASLQPVGLNISEEKFIQRVQSVPTGYSFLQEIPPNGTLNGFLLPGQYDLPREITTDQLIATLLNAFSEQVTNDIRDGISQQDLSLYEGVTLASIVEREAVIEDEQPIIASVFLNRLSSGMKLDADPTIQYALGYNSQQESWWTNPLSLSDLNVDSLYNTYLYAGLPPGPISNPGIMALKAVAFPAQTPYLYFRAACDGSGRHQFALNYEEHNANACE